MEAYSNQTELHSLARRTVFFCLGVSMLGFAIRAFAAEDSTDSVTSPPAHWLVLPERAVVLDIHHLGMETNSPPRAGEFTQSVVQQLVQAGYTIHFSEAMLQRDLQRLESLQDPWSTSLATTLQQGLKEGVLDWPKLRHLHVSASDTEQVSAWLPWLSLTFPTNQLGIAGPETESLAVLSCAVTWSSLPVAGISVRTGYRTRVMRGKGFVYKIGVQLDLARHGQSVAEQTFPAPPWLREYGNISPMMLTQKKVLASLNQALPSRSDSWRLEMEEAEEEKPKKRFFFFRRKKE